MSQHTQTKDPTMSCVIMVRGHWQEYSARERGEQKMDKRDAIEVIGSAIQAYGHFESYSIPGADNCEVYEVLQKICEYYNDDTMLNENYDEGYKLVMKDGELQIYNTKKSEYWTLPAFMKAKSGIYDLFITFVGKFA